MSHQQHGGYESMAREKCPCPTVVARAALLLWAEWIIQRCLSAWGETRTVGSGRATGASLAGACKLDKSYRTIISCSTWSMPEAWRKRKEGGLEQACLHLSQFSVAFFFFYHSCKCRGCCPECLSCTGSLQQAQNGLRLIRHCSFTALLLTRSIYSLCLKTMNTTTNCLCVALPV